MIYELDFVEHCARVDVFSLYEMCYEFVDFTKLYKVIDTDVSNQ